MKAFYKNTYYFWIITKFILAIAVFISAIGNLGIDDLTTSEKAANYLAVLYAILLSLDLIFSLNGNYYRIIKYFIGVISILFAIIIFIVLIKMNVISVPLTLLFSIWIFLLGLFDLLQIKKNK